MGFFQHHLPVKFLISLFGVSFCMFLRRSKLCLHCKVLQINKVAENTTINDIWFTLIRSHKLLITYIDSVKNLTSTNIMHHIQFLEGKINLYFNIFCTITFDSHTTSSLCLTIYTLFLQGINPGSFWTSSVYWI